MLWYACLAKTCAGSLVGLREGWAGARQLSSACYPAAGSAAVCSITAMVDADSAAAGSAAARKGRESLEVRMVCGHAGSAWIMIRMS
jgi:hypothetical protein